MSVKDLDIKTVAIIVLGIGLIISFFFGQRSGINTYKDEIKVLHEENAKLNKSNDSLETVNIKLNAYIKVIDDSLVLNQKKLNDSQLQLDRLKKKRNEIPKFVSGLSADDVANELSNFINTHKKTGKDTD